MKITIPGIYIINRKTMDEIDSFTSMIANCIQEILYTGMTTRDDIKIFAPYYFKEHLQYAMRSRAVFGSFGEIFQFFGVEVEFVSPTDDVYVFSKYWRDNPEKLRKIISIEIEAEKKKGITIVDTASGTTITKS